MVRIGSTEKLMKKQGVRNNSSMPAMKGNGPVNLEMRISRNFSLQCLVVAELEAGAVT